MGGRDLPLGLLVLAATAMYLMFFNAFAVPMIDFFEYRDIADGYLHLELPPDETFKKLPVFVLLIGLVSRLMPGSQPILLAAEMISALLAPVCLWLIYRIARRHVSARASFAVTTLSAVNTWMVYCAAQPLMDMVLLTGILLVIDLAQRGSRWAYAAAFVASLTRYEAVLLIPAVLIQDLRSPQVPDKRRRLLVSALASLGIVSWVTLSMLSHPTINAYAGVLLTRTESYTAFPIGALVTAGDAVRDLFFREDLAAWSRLALVAEAGLLGIGLMSLARDGRAPSMAIILFLLGYTAMHMLYPWYAPRYVLPILWILYLAMARGIEVLVGAVARPRDRRVPVERAAQWAMAAGGVGLLAVLIAVAVRIGQGGLAQLAVYALLCLSVFACWSAPRERNMHAPRRYSETGVGWREGGAGLLLARIISARALRRYSETGVGWREGGVGLLLARIISARALSIPALALCVIAGLGMHSSVTYMRMDPIRSNRAQFKAVAQWYRHAARPGDVMVATLPQVVRYYSRLPYEYFVPSSLLRSTSLDGLIEELRDRGVTYVVLDNEDHGGDEWLIQGYKVGLLSSLREDAADLLEIVRHIRIGSKEAFVYRFQAPERPPDGMSGA